MAHWEEPDTPEVCRRLGPDGRMIGIDQDEDAIGGGDKEAG